MNIIYRISFLSLLVLAVTLFLSNTSDFKVISYHLRTSGNIVSQTGAPGEQNCTSCHNTGTVLDGNEAMNKLSLDDGGSIFTPGEELTLKLEMTDASTKNGFQLVALNDNNEMAGNFIISDQTNTQLRSNDGLGREYVTHTSSGTQLTNWSFNWQTPENGGNVTFYVATNKTADNGTSGGDMIYLSDHEFQAIDVTNTTENEKYKPTLEIGYQPSSNSVFIDFETEKEASISVNIIDLSGRSILFREFGSYYPGLFSEKINLPNDIKNGIHIVTLFVNNKPISKKFMITN